MDTVWSLLESLNVAVKAAARCSSLVDVMIDQDDLLVESLLHLAAVYSACHGQWSVSLATFLHKSDEYFLR